MMHTAKFDGFTLPVWESFTLEGVEDFVARSIADERALADEVAALARPTFFDIVARFEEIALRRAPLVGAVSHLKNVSLNEYPGIDVLEEKISRMLSELSSELSFHGGLYRAHLAVRNGGEYATLSGEQRFMLDRAIAEFERNGVALPPDAQARLKELDGKIVEAQCRFESNVVRATDSWTLQVPSRERLTGVPEAVIAGCAKQAEREGKEGFCVSLRSTVVLTVLDWAENRSLREELWRAYIARASSTGRNCAEYDNGPIMTELLALRDEAARVLGYSCHAARSIAPKMSGAVQIAGVDRFLETLATASLPKSVIDRKELVEFAKTRLGLDDPQPWDGGYCVRLMMRERFGFDEEQVRDYFEADAVFTMLAALSTRLFGVSFREAEVPVWHPSVRFYEVFDEYDALIAGFYVDLTARDGKRGGAWMDCVTPRVDHDGVASLPTAFLIGNFREAGVDGRQFITHDDIQTVFHEFGHVMHHLLGKTNYVESGMNAVEWDAIELPSQLFERWSWDKDVLRTMSAHRETGDAIPDELLDALVASRDYRAGTTYGGQFGLALFDWNVHKGARPDEVGILALFDEQMGRAVFPPVHRDNRRPHAFTHAFGGGYDAGYFSYSWANALVADVAAAFAEAGKNDEAAVGHKYLKEILEVGASRPMVDSFRAFRGRDMDPKYLIPYLGLS